MRARDPRTAARSSTLVVVVCAVVLVGLTWFGPGAVSTTSRTATWAAAALLVVVAVLSWVVPADRLDRTGAFVLLGIGGVLLITTLNIVTQDPSAAAQAFFALPVLWASSHLRRGALSVVTAAAVVGDATSVLVLRPVEDAVIDFVFFGAVLVVTAVMLDRAATAQDRLVRALEQQATLDALTGLVNRRAFDEALAAALAGTPHPQGTALLLLDVDSFKQINDAHGHPVGDDALVHLAGVIRGQIRAGDAVLSRLGGDELAVLLPGCSRDVALLRAESVLETVRASPLALPDGALLAMSVSVGVAHVRDTAGMRDFYAAADQALYRAKRAGRGRVEVAPA